MDKETRRRIEEIRRKYQGNPDIDFLFLELDNRGIKLVDADAMAYAIDAAVKAGRPATRTAITDARENYGTIGIYEHARRALLEALAEKRG